MSEEVICDVIDEDYHTKTNRVKILSSPRQAQGLEINETLSEINFFKPYFCRH